jgi:hypothetical protein
VDVVGSWNSIALVVGSHAWPGQPAYHPVTHSTSADDHGALIPLSEARYNTAVKAQNRLFLSATVAF